MDNPTQVRFVPSVDHGTLTRYELRSVEVVSSTASGPITIGIPTPSGGYCTVDLDTSGWTEDLDYRVEVRSVRGADTSAWALSSNTGVITEPPGEDPLYGPLASIEPPEGAVMLTAGQTSTQLQALITANAAGTTYGIAAGTHAWTGAVTPKTGDTFVGEYGAILDGSGWSTTNSQMGAFLAINVNIDNVTIKNLVIRNMPQRAIYASKSFSDGWLIERNEIHLNRFGFHAGNTFTIRNNSIHHNIGNPLSVVYEERGGAYAAYLATGVVMEDNEIAYNGPEHKWVGTNGVITRGNWVHHNHTDGIWYDADNINAIIEDNVVEDQPRMGIFYEVSGNGIIRNNTVNRNGTAGGDSGIFISCSKDVEIYGNTLEDNFRGITYYVDCDRVGLGGIPGGWDLSDNDAHDNVIRVPSGVASALSSSLQTSSTVCTPEQKTLYLTAKNLTFTNNDYFVPTLGGLWWYWGAYKTWTTWQAVGADTTGSRSLL